MRKITANLRNKGIKTTWRRENILILLLFITFIHINVGMDTICHVRIDMIQSLTMDGFLRNNHVLSQWFHGLRCFRRGFLCCLVGGEIVQATSLLFDWVESISTQCLSGESLFEGWLPATRSQWLASTRMYCIHP